VMTEAVLEFPRDFDNRITTSSNPNVLLAEELARALAVIETKRNQFDVLAIYLPNRWERGFFGPEGDDFDLHDYVKAIAAVRGLPTQVINEDSALEYFCRCSVMWRLSIALYTKAGGVPWKLANTDSQTAYIGL